MSDVDRAAMRYQEASAAVETAIEYVARMNSYLRKAQEAQRYAEDAVREAQAVVMAAASGETEMQRDKLWSEPPITLAAADAQIARLIEAHEKSLAALADL